MGESPAGLNPPAPPRSPQAPPPGTLPPHLNRCMVAAGLVTNLKRDSARNTPDMVAKRRQNP